MRKNESYLMVFEGEKYTVFPIPTSRRGFESPYADKDGMVHIATKLNEEITSVSDPRNHDKSIWESNVLERPEGAYQIKGAYTQYELNEFPKIPDEMNDSTFGTIWRIRHQRNDIRKELLDEHNIISTFK